MPDLVVDADDNPVEGSKPETPAFRPSRATGKRVVRWSSNPAPPCRLIIRYRRAGCRIPTIGKWRLAQYKINLRLGQVPRAKSPPTCV